MPRRARQLRPADHQIRLSLALPSQRHARSPRRHGRSESARPEFVNGLLCITRVKRSEGPTIEKRTMTPRRTTNAAVRPREYLTPEEIRHLLKVARSRPGGYGHRDSTMILIAYRHGLRVSELVTMRWDMLDLKRGTFHVVRRKNGRPSVHLVRGDEIRSLRRVQREQPTGSPYVFVSKRKGPLTVAAFQKLVAASARRPGFPSPSTRTCCGTPAASSSPTTAWTPAPCRSGCATATSSTRRGTPNSRRSGSRIFGRGRIKERYSPSLVRLRRVLHHVGVQLILKIKPWNFPH